MHNAVTLALVPPCNKTGIEAVGTVGLVGRHILPVKHICFSDQVFRGMLGSGEVKTSLTKLIKTLGVLYHKSDVSTWSIVPVQNRNGRTPQCFNRIAL